MNPLKQSSRARGSNRGWCGGGYERTDLDYAEKQDHSVVRAYFSLPPEHRPTYMEGLPRRQQRLVKDAERTLWEDARNRAGR